VALAETTWRLRTLAPPRRVPVRALLGLTLAAAAVAVVFNVNRSTQPRTVEVLRATHDVPVGAILQAGDVTPVSEALPDDVVQVLAPADQRGAFVGKRVGQQLNAGELVSRRQLQNAAHQVPPGQLVYTIPVSPEAAAGGQAIDAGDDVEVLVTTGKGQPDQARTQVVLPRARVYQVGRSDVSYSPLGNTDQVASDSKLTSLTLLLATEADYQAIARARWIGDVDVAVLGTGESD
jgi:Flp pilus assembly protein CpaB